jgi:hypothetical protein
MGLFSYKKALHPVRTTRRAAVRALTPKPIRQARRAVTTVRHPVSSLEGAAKAELRRTVSGSTRSANSARSASAPNALGWGVLVAVLLVVGMIWGGVSAAYHAAFGPHIKAGPQAWTAGDVRSTSSGDYSTINVTAVRCRWNGAHVEAQMRVQNLQRNRRTLTVSPQYTLRGHGSHGGSIDGYTDVALRAGATQVILVNAGKPEGVSGQPTITSCGPDLVDLSY